MNENATETAQKPPISIWKRLLVFSGAIVLLLIALVVVQHNLQGSKAKSRLKELLSALDKSDPGWRFEEMENARIAPPDDENSGRVVRSARALMPKTGLDNKVIERFDKLPPPPELLDDDRAAALDKELSSVAAALELARKLADMPRGKHDIIHSHNPMATLLPHATEAREIASLLQFDSLNLAQKNRAGESLRSCRAALNAGRSMDDEPFIISQLIRIACIRLATDAAERALALGEPPVEELARMQALLEQEESHPTLLVALRGERAIMHIILSRLTDGSIPSAGLFDNLMGPDRSWDERLMMWDGKGMARREHPQVLELIGKAIDNARLPPHEQIDAEEKLNREIKDLVPRSPITRALLPATSKFSDACRRKLAHVRCLEVLLAIERYRRDRGAWPKTLAELSPTLLKVVPLDPYDGKPLRYKPVADGVMVYSVGPDRTDNGGIIDRARPTGVGTDMGYQLWDVKYRRQKAPGVK